MPPLSLGEYLAAAAGAALPPLAWQDVDLRCGSGGDASINVDTVVDNNYKDDGGDSDDGNGNDGDGNDGDGRCDLALALAKPT